MFKRCLTAVIFFILILPMFIWNDTIILNVTVAVFSGISAYEVFKITKIKSYFIFILNVAIAGIIPLLYSVLEEYILIICIAYIIILFIYFIINNNNITFITIAQVFFLEFYVTVFFSSILSVRNLENGGLYLFFLIFISAWITDIFAYFTGFLIGKHKLCPTISPKKTIEGSVGGIVFTVAAYIIYGFILKNNFVVNVNYFTLITLGFLSSVISQIGDLSASLIKRYYNVKDYGKILPGHGGIMDRFDSVLFVAPLIYCYCSLFTVFN